MTHLLERVSTNKKMHRKDAFVTPILLLEFSSEGLDLLLAAHDPKPRSKDIVLETLSILPMLPVWPLPH